MKFYFKISIEKLEQALKTTVILAKAIKIYENSNKIDDSNKTSLI